MHAVLPLLPYREPEILGSVERVTPLCTSLHISSVLLVTDAGLRGAGATDKLEALLREAGIRCAVYDQTRANPTVENVEQARALYLNEKCEALIAFGGGCVNDTIIHLATSGMGFGGVGESGMGAYHGRTGFEAFSHSKSIVNKRTWMDLPMRYQPYKRGLYGKLLHFFLK